MLVKEKGPDRFFAEDRERMTVLVGWIVGIYSYFAYLTDHLTLDARAESEIRFSVAPSGTPTPRSALLRIVTSVPNVIVFGLFGLLALVVWVMAGLFIVVTGQLPAGAVRLPARHQPLAGAAVQLPHLARRRLPGVHSEPGPGNVGARISSGPLCRQPAASSASLTSLSACSFSSRRTAV